MSTAAVIYLGKGNVLRRRLKKDGVVQVLTSLTRVRLLLAGDSGSFVLDSSTDSNLFDWSSEGVTGYLSIKVGMGSVPVGRYSVQLDLYDAVNTGGLIWGDPFRLEIKSI